MRTRSSGPRRCVGEWGGKRNGTRWNASLPVCGRRRRIGNSRVSERSDRTPQRSVPTWGNNGTRWNASLPRGFATGRQGNGSGHAGARCFLRLDRFWVAQYVCLHGVCFPFLDCYGRESHNLWLGTVCAVQPTFTPESRHRFHFHRQPYCLGSTP